MFAGKEEYVNDKIFSGAVEGRIKKQLKEIKPFFPGEEDELKEELDKLNVESKLTTVLLAEVKDGKHIFHTKADKSTAKTPLGAFEEDEIDNDILLVIKALEEY